MGWRWGCEGVVGWRGPRPSPGARPHHTTLMMDMCRYSVVIT